MFYFKSLERRIIINSFDISVETILGNAIQK
jgi:hypothetical protein